MAKFEISHAKTKINEGGYTKHPKDRGNWTGGVVGVGNLAGTKNGISAPMLSKYYGHPITEAEMRAMPKEIELKIYKNDFWDLMWGDKITAQELADVFYDKVVNFGPTGISLMQKSLNLPQTAKMNVKTLEALNK